MPGPYSLQDLRWYTQWTLNKGLFFNMHEVDIPLDGFAAGNNFVFRDGFLRSRPGTAAILDAAPDNFPVVHVGLYARTSGDPLQIMCTIGEALPPYTLYVYVGHPWGVPFSLAAAVPFTYQLSHTYFKDEYYIAPGDEDVLVVKQDATVESLVGRQSNDELKHPGKPRYITSNDGRLWMANTMDRPAGEPDPVRVPYRVHCSDFLNSDIWNGGIDGGSSRYWDLAGEPDPITGIWASGSSVMVFKRRTIYTGQFVGPPAIYDFTRTSRGIGCISHQTIREWKAGILIWLSDDLNVYMGAPGQKPQAVGEAIKERLRAVTDIGGKGNLRMARSFIDFTKDYYHLFVAGTEEGLFDKIFTLDLNTGAWWEGTFPPGLSVFSGSAATQGDYDDINTGDFGYSNLQLGTEDGRILQYDWVYSDDDGEEMVCTLRTGIWNYAKMANRETMEVEPQAVRIIGTDTASSVTLNVLPYQVYNRASGTGFSGTQVMSDQEDMYVAGRCQGESFAVSVIAPATTRIAAIGVGYLPQGDIHRKR